MRAGYGSLVCAGLLIAGCAGKQAEPQKVYQRVPVAVSAGCVVDRPSPVPALNQRVSQAEWDARAPGAKASAIEEQAGERLNYQDQLSGAVAGCKDAAK